MWDLTLRFVSQIFVPTVEKRSLVFNVECHLKTIPLNIPPSGCKRRRVPEGGERRNRKQKMLDNCRRFQKLLWLTMLFSLQLPRSDKMCPSCGEHEAVFFQSQQRSAETGMVRCPHLKTFWREILRLTWFCPAETLLRLLRLR